MLKGKKIGFIGGGKMGEAMMGGLLAKKILAAKDLLVADVSRERLSYLKGLFGLATGQDNKALTKQADIIMLAVKPQILPDVLKEIRDSLQKKTLLISIAAGVSTAAIEERLKAGIRVIRAMPNTPALIGEGVTAVAKGTSATTDDLALAKILFDAVGTTVEVNESLMNAVTGLSGSGPAYVFVMIEALADAGVNMGLGRDTALTLAAQTLLGSAKLYLTTKKHPAELKDMVTSPGGTTIAGLKALEDGKIRATLMSAVEAATLRAKELGGGK